MSGQVAILVALITAMPYGALADEWNKTFKVGPGPELRLETGDGSVEVQAGEAGRIEARVTTSGWRIGPDEVRITERQSGDRVELQVRLPKENWSIAPRSVRIALRVPRDTRAQARTGDGSITVDGLKGESNFTTGDGAIRIQSFDGSLAARTGDGAITFRGRFDQLNLHTGDGSIQGDILEGSRVASGWRVETGDGSVRVGIPSGLAADMDVRTGDGRITSDLTMTVSGITSKSSIRGRLNGGGSLFTIRTQDGSIRLERH